MDAIISFVGFIVDQLLNLILLIVVVYAVMSWLIAFQVVNTRNPFAFRVVRALDAVVNPLLAPFRRILPSMAGLDFSPVLLLLVVIGAQRYLVPALFGWLHTLVGGPVVT